MKLLTVLAVCVPPLMCPPVGTWPFDDSDVGKAMAVCVEHEIAPSTLAPEPLAEPTYESGFENCRDVRALWDAKHRAQRDKETIHRALRSRG